MFVKSWPKLVVKSRETVKLFQALCLVKLEDECSDMQGAVCVLAQHLSNLVLPNCTKVRQWLEPSKGRHFSVAHLPHTRLMSAPHSMSPGSTKQLLLHRWKKTAVQLFATGRLPTDPVWSGKPSGSPGQPHAWCAQRVKQKISFVF